MWARREGSLDACHPSNDGTQNQPMCGLHDSATFFCGPLYHGGRREVGSLLCHPLGCLRCGPSQEERGFSGRVSDARLYFVLSFVEQRNLDSPKKPDIEVMPRPVNWCAEGGCGAG